MCPENDSRAHRTAARASADTEGLTHLAETEAGLLVLRERLAERLWAEPTAPLLALLAERLWAEPTAPLLALLALLQQRDDRGRQRLLHGLLHSAAHALLQRVVQRDSQVRVRVVLGNALLLQLLLNLLDLLQRLLQTLRDLLARLLAGLLDRLLDHLRELLLRGADLWAELLQGWGTGHHRHECSIRRHGKPT
ncbi:hypothetical protein OG369_38830 [Streptomyces sp. NBC_01221]|uniref:hypothetical protein n=1 Tax=Streptomyces sp. NBC_01221 TaxID=2903782 RepID=UPI00224E93F5|nr:hypothetical protein [Streptomyces sp. NBC_01221]MCX4791818.1 hypothetical protein [Streptomyces sp. NBC_01221]